MTIRIDNAARVTVAVYSSDFSAIDALQILAGCNAYNRKEGIKEIRLSNEDEVGRLLKAVSPYLVQKKELADAVIAYISTTDPDIGTRALLHIGELVG